MTERNIRQVEFAGRKVDCWHDSVGYFENAVVKREADKKRASSRRHAETLIRHGAAEGDKQTALDLLHVCRWCFKYTVNGGDMVKHEQACRFNESPPGKLVYRDVQYNIRQVDGADVSAALFCQCLCLFSRLFLDTKSVYFYTAGFEFFVIYDNDSQLPLGYFSREKNSWYDYNLACILVFPPYQNLGIGKLLIAYSYYMTRRAGKVGSPEKPLSTYGRAGYLSYWCRAVAYAVLVEPQGTHLSIQHISHITGIVPEDVEDALHHMNALRRNSILKMAIMNYIAARKMNIAPLINPRLCIV